MEDYSTVVRLMEADKSSEGTFDYPNVFVRRALAYEEIAYGRRDAMQWESAVKDYSKAIDIWRSRPISEWLDRQETAWFCLFQRRFGGLKPPERAKDRPRREPSSAQLQR